MKASDPYEGLGGEAGVRALVERFYDTMDRLPEARSIRAMHAEDLAFMHQALFDFLSGWLGGPPLYYERQDPKCMHEAHFSYRIGEEERDAWMLCMDLALADLTPDAKLRSVLHEAFFRMADGLRNEGKAQPAEEMGKTGISGTDDPRPTDMLRDH